MAIVSSDRPPAPEPGRLRTERLPPGRNLNERWGSWRVLDTDGAPLGVVHELHDFDGEQFGPATYAVAHNPTGGPGEALWSSDHHATVPDALDALTKHLDADPPTGT